MDRLSSLSGASLQGLDGQRVAAAVSGGADSVALALWLKAHQDRNPPKVSLAGIIHVNHQLRGQESDRDEAFCRALAQRLGVPIELVVAPVSTTAGKSPESAARAARYRAFAAAATRLGATRVATAHTADDQAETVLMRLLRGAGNRGVSGIRARRGPYVRPFLGCRRSTIRSWLESQNETYCEDSTNADRSIFRNRLRHDLLPVIEQLTPGGVVALARAATLAADDEKVLQSLAIESAATAVLSAGSADAVLDRQVVALLPKAIARRVLRLVFEKMAPRGAWRARHFDAVLRLAGRASGGGTLDLPGVRVERVSNELRLRLGASVPIPPYAYSLSSEQQLTVVEAGWEISARRQSGASNTPDGAYVVAVPATAFPLTVRNRRPGDRVAMSGGTRKIQDLMVDAKIPRSERAKVPLVVAADGQVLWVIGHAATGRPATGTIGADMVTLKARKLEQT